MVVLKYNIYLLTCIYISPLVCLANINYFCYSQKQNEKGMTSTDPEDKWWKAFSGALEKW